MTIQRIVNATRTSFRNCLREQNLDCVTSLYHKKAILKGTFATKPTEGHEGIKKYFKKLIRDVNDVKFDKEPIMFKKQDMIFVLGKYDFILKDGQKIKATYQFVLEDGKIMTHFSALNK